MDSQSEVSRLEARDKMANLLDMSLQPGHETGAKVGEAAAWLLTHVAALHHDQGQEEEYGRFSIASHALIACRHKQVFGMAAEHDLAKIVRVCHSLARIYTALADEVADRLPPIEWADPLPSWKALELGVVGAASQALAAIRYDAGLAEAQECASLATVLLEMASHMALHEKDATAACQNWAGIAMLEFLLPDFDATRVVPLNYLDMMVSTFNALAEAYTLGKDFSWAFSSETKT